MRSELYNTMKSDENKTLKYIYYRINQLLESKIPSDFFFLHQFIQL